MNIQTFKTEENFTDATVKFVSKICQSKSGIIRIALSGGSTAKTIYEALSKTDLPFKRIEFFQVDERYVPKKHPDSNYKMLTESLKKPIYHFNTSLGIKEALEKYEKELPTEPFDLIVLGIGPDGHTASLFPHSKTLEEERTVAHGTTEEFAIKDRLTLTFRPILRSKTILVLLKGKNKKPILKKLKTQRESVDSVKEIPAIKLLEHKDLNVYFCEE